jgi:hypothetical protein
MAPSKPTFRATELVDLTALRTIVHNWQNLRFPGKEGHPDRKTPVDVIKEYLKRTVAGDNGLGLVKVTYLLAKGKASGRQFACDSISLQCVERKVRHTIAGKIYRDFDMVNAHPVILRQWCEKNGVSCPVLTEYIDDRDAKFSELFDLNPGLDRDQAKKIVLSLMNGGDKDYRALRNKPEWLLRFQVEVERIHAAMIEKPEHTGLVRDALECKGRDGNIPGSVCNRVLCEVEDDLLRACIDFVRANGISVENAVLAFDGFMLPKSASQQIDDAFLVDMAEYVFSSTGYKVTMSEKAMNTPLDLTGLPVPTDRMPLFASTDVMASYLFQEILRPYVIQCDGVKYALTQDRTWTCKPCMVKDIMLHHAKRSNIKMGTPEKPVAFSSTCSGVNTLLRLVEIQEDATFQDRLFDNSLFKIFFQDGVYDFTIGAFREEDPEKDMTDRRIPRPFPKKDPAKMKEVFDRVVASIFANRFDAQCYLQHIARAMAGCYEDKDWVVLISERNGGKGVLTQMNENAWGKYVVSAHSDSFLMQKQQMGEDKAKSMSWLLSCAGARMITTQEITMDTDNKSIKINGNMVKGVLTGGGDKFQARKNYQDETEVRIQARLFMAMNDMPPVTPADVMETMHMFSLPYQFLQTLPPKPLPYMKLADQKIKQYCKQQEVIDAYTWLVIDAWNDFKVIKSEAVRIESQRFHREAGNEWDALLEVVEVTKDKKDMVSSKELLAAVKRANICISIQKARQRLEKLGVKYSENAVVDGARVRGFMGMKLLPQEGDPDVFGEACDPTQA